MLPKPLLSSLALAALLSLPASGSMRSQPDLFFKPGPEIPESLSETVLYPKGRRFLFTFFSVGGGSETAINALLPEKEVQEEFRRYKALEIPIFGPQYELNDRSPDDAARHGLDFIYTVGLPMNFHDRSKEGKPALDLSPAEVEKAVEAQVKAMADNQRLVVWYLRPEELRPWKKKEMAYLEAASRAVRKADPLKRPIWIYDPAHASARRLASIAPWVDYLGKGMYPNYVSQKESRIWCRWSMEQEVQAIADAGASSIPLAVPEMFRQPGDEELPLIPKWVRHDVYLSLIHGAKGVTVFSARRRPNFPAREAYMKAYAEVASQLIGPRRLADAFLFGERRSDLSVDVTQGPAEVELLYPSGGVKEPLRYPSLSHLDVALGKARYLFVVNSANARVSASIGGMPYNAVHVESLLDGSAPFDVGEGEFELDLEPYEVKALLLKPR